MFQSNHNKKIIQTIECFNLWETVKRDKKTVQELEKIAPGIKADIEKEIRKKKNEEERIYGQQLIMEF